MDVSLGVRGGLTLQSMTKWNCWPVVKAPLQFNWILTRYCKKLGQEVNASSHFPAPSPMLVTVQFEVSSRAGWEIMLLTAAPTLLWGWVSPPTCAGAATSLSFPVLFSSAVGWFFFLGMCWRSLTSPRCLFSYILQIDTPTLLTLFAKALSLK